MELSCRHLELRNDSQSCIETVVQRSVTRLLTAQQLWDLFQPARLFSAKSSDGQYSESHHLAQMVAILGDPPPDFLAASETSSKYWDQNGESRMYSGCATQASSDHYTQASGFMKWQYRKEASRAANDVFRTRTREISWYL